MPREPRVQTHAEFGDQYRTRGSPGVSPWLVVGIVVLAASLVAVGALVVLSSLDLRGTGTAGSTATAASPVDRAVADAMARLTTDEDRVGQLLLLAWIGSTAEEARPVLRDLRAGGIVYVQNTSSSAEAQAINQSLKQLATDAGVLPPLIAIDHEGGIVQRIKDIPNLGNNWDFAAKQPTELQACQRGLAHAQVLRQMGFSVNLAPVLDVNNNPANPVIGKRSYS